MSTRIDRISEEVRKALAEAIRSVRDPRVQNGLVSVVHCEVTNDLRYAKALFPCGGSEQQAKEVMKGLKSAAGWLRREVGHKVQLRYAPELVFELDNSITHGAHISELLHELKSEGQARGRRTAHDRGRCGRRGAAGRGQHPDPDAPPPGRRYRRLRGRLCRGLRQLARPRIFWRTRDHQAVAHR